MLFVTSPNSLEFELSTWCPFAQDDEIQEMRNHTLPVPSMSAFYAEDGEESI